MKLISENIEIIITFITMIVTLAKRSDYINNNAIIIQNILMGIISSILYYIITKDFSMAISISGIFAETGYNLIHNIQKLVEEVKNDKDNKTTDTWK